MKIQVVNFVVQGLFFNEVARIYEQDRKLLLTQLVVQCRNILPSAFSALTFLRTIYSCTDLPLS